MAAFWLMAPALQAPSRDREVEMQAGVHAASTVDRALARVLARLAEAAELLGEAEDRRDQRMAELRRAADLLAGVTA